MSDTVFIPVNRRRLLLQVILFGCIGIAGLIAGFGLGEKLESNAIIWKAFGVIICLFALLAAGAKARKRTDKTAGLTISSEGINDTSSEISIGMIPWKDVKTVDPEASKKAGLLIVKVKNANSYIKNARNSAIERLLRQNQRNFETPVVIEAGHLSCSLEELIDLVSQHFKK